MASHPLNIVFIAAHNAARTSLDSIIKSKHKISLIISLANERESTKSGYDSFEQDARKHNISFLAIKSVNEPQTIAAIKKAAPDIMIVLGWSELLKPEVLSIPKIYAIGAHTSLLPKSRGRSPLNWALINDEKIAGVTIFTLEPHADTGRILDQVSFTIDDNDDINTLYKKAEKGISQMLLRILSQPNLPEGKLQDDSLSSYYPKRRPSDGHINFTKDARTIWNLIRATTEPYPCAFFYIKQKPVAVISASVVASNENKIPGTVLAVDEKGILISTTKDAIFLKSFKIDEKIQSAQEIIKKNRINIGDVLQKNEDYPPIIEYRFTNAQGNTKEYPTNVKSGSTCTVCAQITNHQQNMVTLQFSLSVDKVITEKKIVTFAKNESRVEKFDFTLSAGRHEVLLSAQEASNDKNRFERTDSLVVEVFESHSQNSAKLLDGKSVAARIIQKHETDLATNPLLAHLAVILVGNNPASEVYVSQKKNACNKAGIRCTVLRFMEQTPEEQLVGMIRRLNIDEEITGILVQLPLPSSIDTQTVLDAVDSAKDVDGLSSARMELLSNGDETLTCCTPKGMLRLIDEYNIDLRGKHIVVVGRGKLVGKPLGLMLNNRKLLFTLVHSKTPNPEQEFLKADVIFSSTGVPHLIKNVKKGAIVVDAGWAQKDGKTAGDVDFEIVSKQAAWITPTIGGVGPMTIAMLIENTIRAAREQAEEK